MKDDSISIGGPVGADLLVGAMDNHIHACPHINARCLDVFEAVEAAAASGMCAIGLMDNFANTSGYAALANRRLGHLGVEVFGGLIMEPPAGGVSAEAVRIALGYGYGARGDGARFISLPTHHTRAIARREGRSAHYIDACLEIPERGPLPAPLPKILDLVAAAGVVFNTGHISGPEALRIVEIARAAGVERILVPAGHFAPDEISALAALGAIVEFSFFSVTHATQIGLTDVDAARHMVSSVPVHLMAERVAAAGPASAVLSSDCGVFVLPSPPEGLREFLLLLREAGIAESDLRRMVNETPKRLFRCGQHDRDGSFEPAPLPEATQGDGGGCRSIRR